MKKQIVRHAVAVFILLTLSFAVELVCFQGRLLGNAGGVQPVSLESIQTVGLSREGEALTAAQGPGFLTIPLSGSYLDKLEYGYHSDTDFTAKMQLEVFDRYGNPSVIQMEDKASAKLTRSVQKIGREAASVTIEVPQGTTITYLQIRNVLSVNWMRLLFVFAVLGAAYFLIAFRKLLARRVEVGFLAVCLCLGVVFVCAAPLVTSAWDEQIHYKNAAQLARPGANAYWTAAGAEACDYATPKGATTWEEQQDVFGYLQSINDKQNIVRVTEKSVIPSYTSLAYLPQALLYGLADLIGLPFAVCYMLGRLGNLLLYAAVMFFAIRILPSGKRIAAVVGLMPTPLFIASSFSYDAVVFSFLLLGFAVFLEELRHPERLLTFGKAALLLGSMVFACFPKAVYIPLLLLALMFPKEKFSGRKEQQVFRIGVVVLVVLMLSTLVLPTLLNPSSVADVRGGDTDTAGQLGVILGHPFAYAGLFLQSVGEQLFNFTLGHSVTLDLAYLGIVGDYNVQTIKLILLVFLMLTDYSPETELPRKVKGWLIVTLAAIVGLIWTALYLSFTPVGLDGINGVQGRYYLPLLMPLYLLLHTRRIECRLSAQAYNLIALAGGGAVTAYSLYQIVLCGFVV